MRLIADGSVSWRSQARQRYVASPIGMACGSLHAAWTAWNRAMATKVEAAGGRLYEDDFYAWTREQAALLRARRFAALDLGHLALAIQEAGDLQREAALGNARVVIEHLLKLPTAPPRTRATAGAPRSASTAPPSSSASRRSCARPCRTSCRGSTRSPAATPRARYAITASPRSPTRRPPSARTRSTSSPPDCWP